MGVIGILRDSVRNYVFGGLIIVSLAISTLGSTGCTAKNSQTVTEDVSDNSSALETIVDEKPLSAKESFEVSLPVARAWSKDAVLVSATATVTWPDVNLANGKATWAFYFISPSAKEGKTPYVVTVSNGKAEGIQQPKATAQANPIDSTKWKIDSAQAVEAYLEAGGKAMLENQKKADVNIRLTAGAAGGEPVWIISAFSNGSPVSLVQVGAEQGNIKG